MRFALPLENAALTRGTVCRMGVMSVNLYSSFRVVGIRTVRSAAVHSSRIAASLLPRSSGL